MEGISVEPLKKSDTLININRVSNINEDLPLKPWRSCCFEMDKSCVKYFTQVSILYLLIIYSCTMLIVFPDCESQRNFAGLLMIAIGTLIPSPKFG